MKTLSAALRILAVVAAILLPVLALAAWEDDLIESVASPVFDAAMGTSIYYPTILYDADGFGSGAAGPFYKMWFSNGKNTDANIGTAESMDGTTWTLGADCAGLTNPHHAEVLYDANVFGGVAVGRPYRIWYMDANDATRYSIAAIRTAASDDGIHWVNDQPLQQDAGKPIITGVDDDWNRGSYGPVHLFYQPGKPNAGDDPFNYEYVMYYDGTTGGFEQVGLGYSADGVTWTRYGDGPVLESGVDWSVPGNWGTAIPWDSSYVGFGTVIRDASGKFHFWFSGGSMSMDMGIGYASSDDGIVWTKDAANPFVEKAAGTWHSKRAYTPAVLYDAARFSGHGDNSEFKLWYAGRDDSGTYHLGYLGRTVVLPPDDPADDGGDDAVATPAETPDGTIGGDDGGTDTETAFGLGGAGGCGAQLVPYASAAAPATAILFELAVVLVLAVRRRYSLR